MPEVRAPADRHVRLAQEHEDAAVAVLRGDVRGGVAERVDGLEVGRQPQPLERVDVAVLARLHDRGVDRRDRVPPRGAVVHEIDGTVALARVPPAHARVDEVVVRADAFLVDAAGAE